MADFPQLCIDDLKTKLELLSEVATGESIYVYDQDALLHQAAQLQMPYFGVIYEGMFSDGDGGNCSKGGLSASLKCAIYIVIGGETYAGTDLKPSATDLLEKARNEIRLTKSPTGHPWNFQEEILAPYDQETFGYIQRWQTKAMLTQGIA